jgi:hypothetical protein
VKVAIDHPALAECDISRRDENMFLLSNHPQMFIYGSDNGKTDANVSKSRI